MRAKYTGSNGEYHEGIPARDLTEEDWSQLDDDQRKLVRSSSIYQTHSEPEKPRSEPKEG